MFFPSYLEVPCHFFQKRQRFYRYVLRRRWFQLRGRDAILRDADEGTKWRDWCRFWGTAKGWSFFLPEMARLGEIWTNKNVPWTSNSGFKMFRRWCCNFFSGDDSLNLIMAETYWQLSQVWKWQTCFFLYPDIPILFIVLAPHCARQFPFESWFRMRLEPPLDL